MKRIILLFVVAISYCNILSAQWVQSQFDTHTPSISAKANIAFLHDGSMIIYHREVDKYGIYHLSKDNGKTWEQKNTSSIVTANIPGTDFCWGFNAFEEDAGGNLYLSYRYRPCYDLNSMQYLLFNSRSSGESWSVQSSFTTPAHITWNTTANQNTVENRDDIWCMQTLNNGNTVIAGISTYSIQMGKVFVYIYSDKNNSWTKKTVSLSNKEITANILPGCRFFDELNGILFLGDKYLVTSDGGDNWIANNYPVADKVVSADAYDAQNIFISTGAKVYKFGEKSLIASTIYECAAGDDVYKVISNNNDLHLLTKNGYYLRNSSLVSITSVADVIAQITTLYAFPQPAIDQVTFAAAKMSLKNTIVSVFDITGKLIDRKLCVGATVNFDVKNLSSGIYFAEVQNENGQKSGYLKWTKQ